METTVFQFYLTFFQFFRIFSIPLVKSPSERHTRHHLRQPLTSPARSHHAQSQPHAGYEWNIGKRLSEVNSHDNYHYAVTIISGTFNHLRKTIKVRNTIFTKQEKRVRPRMNSNSTYEDICSQLGYEQGLLTETNSSHSPIQNHLFIESKKLTEKFDAIYFKGNEPVIYVKLLSQFNEDEIITLHRKIWNQNRVPFLYIITPGELRIYNCFEKPANPELNENLDSDDRLIRHIKVAANLLEQINEFSKINIETGELWNSESVKKIKTESRVDFNLLENIKTARRELHENFKLSYSIIHNLIGRSIFILYLEDRGVINERFYDKFLSGGKTFFDIILNENALYELFSFLEVKFNGDLFPVTSDEKQTIRKIHLKYIYELFHGTNIQTGQTTLWRPYDFGIIPIELISAIYENFLRVENGEEYTSKHGAFYTSPNLVEFILNEILPWPSEKDHEYNFTVLDPACGSGIFLVESYRRLVERWIYCHNGNRIPPEVLKQILKKSIFGIDNKSDAIKVAAFSLYLALLDYLEPKTIWTEIKLPHLIHHSEREAKETNNLFPMDSFQMGPFENVKFDIIVGNPPWKRDNLPLHISEYLSEKGFGQEFAQAFLWRVRDFSENGKIALVGPSKILFNSERYDKNFRHEFFKKNYVEMVVNFSALRRKTGGNGKPLFISAIAPATVFFYRHNAPKDQKKTILYCTPKPSKTDLHNPNISIDSSEIKFLPREKCVSEDYIWKVAMWGTQRDFLLIEKLKQFSKLNSKILPCNRENTLITARGFQTSPRPELQKLNPELSDMSFIDASDVTRYWINPTKIVPMRISHFARFGCLKTYRGPHVLIKLGQSERNFCAAFTTVDCAFRDVISGITGAAGDTELMKSLTAYLNSSFSAYYLFLTTSSWGVERDKTLPNEIFDLPDIPFKLSDVERHEIANLFDKISDQLSQGEDETHPKIVDLKNKIDELIYSKLDLSKSDRFLIEDLLNNSLDFFQKGDKSISCSPVEQIDLEGYANTFCRTVNSILKFGGKTASATIFIGNSPLTLISIHYEKRSTLTIKKS